MGSRRPPPPASPAIVDLSNSGGSSLSSSSTTTTTLRGGGGGPLAARFHLEDVVQVNALWSKVKEEVLDPLEIALLRHFDPKATEVVRAKYYDIYT